VTQVTRFSFTEAVKFGYDIAKCFPISKAAFQISLVNEAQFIHSPRLTKMAHDCAHFSKSGRFGTVLEPVY
jgi:hypothetical protein